jgi:hypothetical protein
MTWLQTLIKWFWVAGMVVLPMAAAGGSWSQFHAQSYAEASAASHLVFVPALTRAFWSLGGLIWFQRYNKDRMPKSAGV